MDAATPASFANLIVHRQWVRRLARSLVLDEARADDLEQEVWIEALVRPPRHGTSPKGWLATALRHNAIDEARVEKRRTAREAATARREAQPSAAELVAETDAMQRVVRAVLDLPEPYRGTILLRFFEDLGPTAIAERECVPVETVRTRLRRGLDLVRESFDRENKGDRRAWCLLLLPLARRSESGAVAGAAVGATLFASMAFKVAAASLVLAAAGFAYRFASAPGAEVVAPAMTVGSLANQGNRAVPAVVAPAVLAPLANIPAAPAGARLECVVQDTAGAPVAGARVDLTEAEPASDGFKGSDAELPRLEPTPPRESRTSDARGRVNFDGVPDGLWTLTARAPSVVSESKRIRVSEGAKPPPIHLLLLPAGRIEGRIALADGKAVAGALVSALGFGNDDVRTNAAVRSDAKGGFLLEPLPPGRYMLAASLPGGNAQLSPIELVVPGAPPQELVLVGGLAARIQVVDDVTGGPVAGARVSLGVISPGPPPAMVMATETTGADGTTTLKGVPAGRVLRLVLRHDEYLPYSAQEGEGGVPSGVLAAGKDLEATVRLRRGVTLQGRVTDIDGKPILGAEVRFVWKSPQGGAVGVQSTSPVTTDARGAYAVRAAEPVTGLLVVHAAGFSQPGLEVPAYRTLIRGSIPEEWRVTVEATGENKRDIALVRCGSVEGIVTDSDGRAVAGAAVSVVPPSSTPIARTIEPAPAPPVWTDAAGRYRIENLPPGEVTLRASHGARGLIGIAGPVSLVAGAVATLPMELHDGATLSGTVLDGDGRPVQGAVLRVARGGVDREMETLRERILAALEAEAEVHPVGIDGAFRVEGLESGKVSLFASADGFQPVRGVEVDVVAGEVLDGVRLVLGGERALRGRILDEKGVPAAGVAISVQDLDSSRMGDSWNRAGSTDAKGEFRITGLTAARYRIQASMPGRPDVVEEGAPGGEEVILRLRMGRALGGVVTDAATGKPLAGIRIAARFLRGTSIHDMAGGMTTSGSDGSFRIEGLDAGPYQVTVGHVEGSSPYQLVVLDSVESGTTGLAVALREGASIEGRVLDEKGDPITSIVTVFASFLRPDGTPDHGPTKRSAGVRADGTFQLAGLAPGRYSLMFSPIMGTGSPGYVICTVSDVSTGTKDLVVRMSKGVVVRGRVVTEDGSPPPAGRGRVTIRPSGAAARDHASMFGAAVKADGTFVSDPLDPEVLWDIFAPQIPGLVGATRTEVRPGVEEIVLVMRKGGVLRGRIINEDGNPVAGMWVAAKAVGFEQVSGGLVQARSGEDGRFVLEGLGEFKFRVQTMRTEYQPAFSADDLVPGQEIELRVLRGFVLSGRLVDASGKAMRAENLTLTPESGGEGLGVVVAEDGSFRFRGLAKGRYALWIRSGNEKIELGSFEVPSEGVEVRGP